MKNRIWLALLLLFALAGCAGEMYRREGMELINSGKPEEGLAALAKAAEEYPSSALYRKTYLEQRDRIADQMLVMADKARQEGNYAAADKAYRRILAIDETNSKARMGLDFITRDKRHAAVLEEAGALYKAGSNEQALFALKAILNESPMHPGALSLKREITEGLPLYRLADPSLKSSYTRPINLEFREANVKFVFEALSRLTGANFILDKDVRPDLKTTIFLRNATIDEALDLVAQTSQLQRKVLSDNTILIYPGTPEKLKEYQDLVVRGFYLHSAEAKNIQNTLKTLLKIKDSVVDEKLNLIIVRDTPDAIRLVEQLIAVQDIPEPEVMLEVEVLEVQRSRLTAIGIQWPDQLTFTPLGSAVPTTSPTSGSGSGGLFGSGSGSGSGSTSGSGLTVADLRNMNSSTIGVSTPTAIVNLRRDVTDADILANPKIRVRNREKAKILIGDKLPIVNTTSTATGFVAESIQYIDVGLKLDVEPVVRLQSDVALNIALEVSSVTGTIPMPSGAKAFQIGTRNAVTSLLLRDGETQILAGLISGQERSSGKRVPGLGDIPILGRLFGSQEDDNSKTEIVLSITPRILRGLNRPEASQIEFWSGTESRLKTQALAFKPAEKKAPIAATAGMAAAPAGMPAAPPLESASGNIGRTEAHASRVQLSWQGPPKLKVGEEAKFSLVIKTDGSIRSLPVQLGVDPKVLQITEISEGAFFNKDNRSVSFSKNIDGESGKAYVSIARSDVNGVSGEGVAITVAVRALAEASATALKVLQASAISEGEKQPAVSMPAPFSFVVEK